MIRNSKPRSLARCAVDSSEPTIRDPEQIRKDAARKLRAVQIADARTGRDSRESAHDRRSATVAVSRTKRKMILGASRCIFSMFSTDEETFANSLLWKNLLLRTCSTLLWEGERDRKKVTVWMARNKRAVSARIKTTGVHHAQN